MRLEVVADEVAAIGKTLAGNAGNVGADMVALVDGIEDVGNVALDRFRRDAVFLVIGHLLLAAARGLVHRPLHGAGDVVGIEDDLAVDVSRGAADRLDERGFGAQETFLVGIEDGDEAAFGNVEALAQQVDADQHVEGAEAQIPDDLDALQRVDVGMHVADAHALLVQVFGEVFRHALGEHGAERAITLLRGLADLAEHVVHLGAGGADLDGRVDEAGRADDLFGEDAAGLFHLPVAGRGGDGDSLRPHGVPFLEAQRPVVHARRQAEAVFGKRRLAAEVAAIHAADLRDGDMALVDEDQRIVGNVFEEGRRRLAGAAAGEVARIVLDAGAGAGRLHHLDVVAGALLQPLGLQQPAGRLELGEPVLQLLLDLADRGIQRRARCHIVRIGVDLDGLEVAGLAAGQGVEFGDRVDLVAEHGNAPGGILQVGGEDLDRVAAHPERAAGEVDVLALVLLGDEVGEQLALVEPVADRHLEGHRGIGFHRADTVDAGDRGDDDAVVALEDGAGCGVAHPVDLLVDRRFLLDIGVGARHIGFRLVVVVVGDEILHRIVGEEALELRVELRGERLVGRQDHGRALGRLDHLGHGEGLARAGDAEQDLGTLARVDALDEIGDRRRLVAGRLVFRGHADRDAAFRLFRPGRPVRRPELAVLEQRIAGFDELRQRVDGGGDGAGGKRGRERLGLLEADVEAGDRVEAGGGAGLRVRGGADRHAAGGLRGRGVLRGGSLRRGGLRGGRLGGGLATALADQEVRHDVVLGSLFGLAAALAGDLRPVAAGLRGDLAPGLDAGGFRLRLQLPHPVGNAALQRTGKRRALEGRLRGFGETASVFRCGRGGLAGGSGHPRNMAAVRRKVKGAGGKNGYKRETGGTG